MFLIVELNLVCFCSTRSNINFIILYNAVPVLRSVIQEVIDCDYYVCCCYIDDNEGDA
jgi:hypothetical protein